MDILLAAQIDLVWVVVAVAAWFLQMGFHEGAHAFAADRLGDRLPRSMGKCTVNPFKHIEWQNGNYVIGAVVMPVVTAMMGWIPMGMAYVMHSPMNTRDSAKVAIAGPIGSFVVALMGLVLWILIYPLVGDSTETGFGHIVYVFCRALIVVSVVYAAFNLIPLPPLDGGTVTYHFLPEEGRDFFRRVQPYGFFILIGIFWILPPLTGGAINLGVVFGYLINFSKDIMYTLPQGIWGTSL